MQNSTDTTLKHLSIGKASKYLGVSIDTLRRWEKKGKLSSRRSPGGHRYFLQEELDQAFNPRAKEKVSLPKSEVKEVSTEKEELPTPTTQIPEVSNLSSLEVPGNEPLKWESSEPSPTTDEAPLVLNESVTPPLPETPAYQPPYVEEIPLTPAESTPQEEPLVLNESTTTAFPAAPSYEPPYVEEIPSTPPPPTVDQLSRPQESLASIKENAIRQLAGKKTFSKIFFIFLGLFLLIDIFLFFYWLGLRGGTFLSPLP